MTATNPTETSYGFTGGSDSRAIALDASCDFLLVKMFSRINPGAVTADYNGVTLTDLTGVLNIGSVIYGSFWYLANPAVGSHTMHVTCPNFHPTVVEVMSLAGVDTADPFHSQGANNWLTSQANPGAAPSITLASGVGEFATDMVGLEAASDATLAVSGGSGVASMAAQIRQDDGTNFERVGASKADGASTVTLSWSISGSKTYLQIGVSLKPTAGGVVVPTLTTLLAG